MIRVLVVGAAGQLARALSSSHMAAIEIISLGRPHLDLTKPSSIQQALDEQGPNIIINCAAFTQVDRAETAEALAFKINADGAGQLAKMCSDQNIPIIHISTDYVFDGTKQTPYLEKDPPNPINAYGRTKFAGEQMVARANPRHVILRTSWVYSSTGTNFVKTMLHLAEKNDTLTVIEDQVGCPTYAPHLAVAILAIVKHLAEAAPKESAQIWGTYHLAGQGEASWYDFAREIFDCSSRFAGPTCEVTSIKTKDYQTLTPARRPSNSRLDTQKFLAEFGVMLPDWHEGVYHCVGQLLALKNMEMDQQKAKP